MGTVVLEVKGDGVPWTLGGGGTSNPANQPGLGRLSGED